MLVNKDLYDEIAKVQKAIDEDKTLSVFERMQLKTQLLMLKLLHNIRTNSVIVMKHLNIDMGTRKRNDSEKKEKK